MLEAEGDHHEDIGNSSREEWKAVQMSLDPWTTVVVKGKSNRAATSRLSPVVVACDFPSPSFRHVAPLSMDPATPARVQGLVASHHQRRKVIPHLSSLSFPLSNRRRPLSELMKTQEILKGVESQRLRTFFTSKLYETWPRTASSSQTATLRK
jgi:hypothetical protein